MTRIYLVTGCKEIEGNNEWYIKIETLEIEAKDRTDAEWKAREKGYFPFSVIRSK